jgi:hypothetical protein
LISPNYRRPYYWRPYVLVTAAVHFTAELDRYVSTRRIEAAWKYARRAGNGRAQPGEPAYADAREMDVWLQDRLDKVPAIGAIVDLTLEQLAALSPDF